MNANAVYDAVTCALTNDHIVKEPIHLTACGHCICKCCIGTQKIECKICGKTTIKKDLKIKNETIPVKGMIKLFLADLFVDLEKRTSEGVDKIKSNNFCIKRYYST